MLSRAHRLQKDAQVKRVLDSGTKQKFGPLLTFTTSSDDPIKFAVVVSKKVSKLAVERNYLRRLTYELIRTNGLNSELTGEVVLVLLYQPENPKEEIEANLKLWFAKRLSV